MRVCRLSCSLAPLIAPPFRRIQDRRTFGALDGAHTGCRGSHTAVSAATLAAAAVSDRHARRISVATDGEKILEPRNGLRWLALG